VKIRRRRGKPFGGTWARERMGLAFFLKSGFTLLYEVKSVSGECTPVLPVA
jgi:hypothetical protein